MLKSTLLRTARHHFPRSLKIIKPCLVSHIFLIKRQQSTTALSDVPKKTRQPTKFSNATSVKSLNTTPLIIHNKKYSESGKLLKLQISANAITKLKQIAKDDANDKLALKISVESGGCHGFQYNLHLVDLTEEQITQITNRDISTDSRINEQKANEEEEEEEEDPDCILEKDNVRVIIDSSSLRILQDSTVDYTTELIGSMFKVIDSPFTSSACGCGSSFDVDFEKIEKEHLESKEN